MIEGRAIISNIQKTKDKIEKLGGIFKNYYAFKDIIFVPKKENYHLSDDFLRIRVMSKNNWSTKDVVLIRKQTIFKKVGKIDNVLLKKEFDEPKEALNFIDKELSLEFEYGFEYLREGWQYELKNHRIFVEDIKEFKPSIEIEADSEENLQSLFNAIGIIESLKKSIPEIMEEIKQNKKVTKI